MTELSQALSTVLRSFPKTRIVFGLDLCPDPACSHLLSSHGEFGCTVSPEPPDSAYHLTSRCPCTRAQ